MKKYKSLICTECKGQIKNLLGCYYCSKCGKEYPKGPDNEENDILEHALPKKADDQAKIKVGKENKKKIIKYISVFVICIVIICGFLNNKSNKNTEQKDKGVGDSKSTTYTSQKNSSKKVKLPDSLFFMTDLDPIDNGNGTYSFYGYITDIKTSQYSSYPTTYITAANGSGFSTGQTAFLYQIYVRNDGTYGTIGADAMYESYYLQGILFKFTYDSSGNLVEITQ